MKIWTKKFTSLCLQEPQSAHNDLGHSWFFPLGSNTREKENNQFVFLKSKDIRENRQIRYEHQSWNHGPKVQFRNKITL